MLTPSRLSTARLVALSTFGMRRMPSALYLSSAYISTDHAPAAPPTQPITASAPIMCPSGEKPRPTHPRSRSTVTSMLTSVADGCSLQCTVSALRPVGGVCCQSYPATSDAAYAVRGGDGGDGRLAGCGGGSAGGGTAVEAGGGLGGERGVGVAAGERHQTARHCEHCAALAVQKASVKAAR